MKRRADGQPVSAISAIAVRKRAQQTTTEAAQSSVSAPSSEPPSKRSKPSPIKELVRQNTTRSKIAVVIESPKKQTQPKSDSSASSQTPSAVDEESEDNDVTSDYGRSDEIEINTAESYDFLLSKGSLTESDIVYKHGDAICIRLKERTTITIVGQYDLWVKRGVISIFGAKLSPTPQLYRVYAPSTHSIPVIKTIAGVNGYAEIEIKSCHNGLPRLRWVSDLYRRIWSAKQAHSRKCLITGPRVSFSILHSSSDDPFKRHLRPLHLDKQWGVAIKELSGRGAGLRAMTCGPKGSGKSTFNKYLLNHLLSPISLQSGNQPPKDGVAYLDLDPGQPEFSPPGQIYLAHIQRPVLGPSFSHPALVSPNSGSIIRAHHIGATSPKDDPDHYVLCVMDLLNRYRILLQSYPGCPLIINYPGWIFGQGLEIATWFIKYLELSDVVYMSVQGPEEVIVPLQAAAFEVGVPVTTLPSQPTEFVTRSSWQLRSMQTLSYFHMVQNQTNGPFWSHLPIQHHRSISVSYSGENQGIFGVMIIGFRHDPDHLHDLLDGSIVSITAVENPDILGRLSDTATIADASANNSNSDPDIPVDDTNSAIASSSDHPLITRTHHSNLPYLFIGNGTCTAPDPASSYSLGLALVRSINTQSQTIQLTTPVSPQFLRAALDLGHRIILVRGNLDNPNWALSEEYFSFKAAQRRHRKLRAESRANSEEAGFAGMYAKRSRRLAERVRRATKDVPWMRVVKQGVEKRREHGAPLWKLKDMIQGGESDGESEQLSS
ncbi:Polynucleotide 5'-hydroxyl-kinase grc3 [Emydomyces testavorans]|uniref:Polynucleotide 5'-hydroxyl-kinase GRC3 n=1 Tax=Emydomyces testavorans TaxID=2070801 RepID=A0AAF0IL78_9EURO|nr:Polynucleotide 5'-hydroxyl-kinase grc3 [Emydomyces testavorans]